MNYTEWNDFNVSRLTLGTVQFGLPYGVANRTGQPSYREVVEIVRTAVEGGITCIDTAALYGESEEVLGRVIKELKLADQILLVTKVRFLDPSERADAALARKAIEDSVSESRRRLNLDCLPVVLFHREADAAHLDVLTDLGNRGWLKHAGVSCDNEPGAAAEFVAARRVAALQLPGNLLDPRHLNSGVLNEARKQGVAVFNRSAFLQGLAVMPEVDIPEGLRDVIPVRRRLDLLAAEAAIGLPELALRYVLSLDGVTSVVVGVETVDQIRENLAMADQGPLPPDLMNAVRAAVPELPERLISPKLWHPKPM